MLKSNSVLSWVYGVLFFLLLWVILYSKYGIWDNSIVFEYPEQEIEFAWDKLPMNGKNFDNKERFDKEFLGTSNNLYQFYLYVKRYPEYIPYIEKELKKAWIHDDFKYLPIAESALRDDVVSSAGAWWIWQFMPETGKRYGLRIDEYVDERYDFEKATWAAIEYLSDLYEDFWDWALVAAAYNRW
jgi:membrane-bound lytic murein transglycosylase D